MRTTAIALSRFRLASQPGFGGATPDFITFDEAARDGARGVHCARRIDDRTGSTSIHCLGSLQFSQSPQEPVPLACSICGTTPTSMP